MRLGDRVCVTKYESDYYKAVGVIVRLFTAVINTYPEKMATVRFEPAELLKLGISPASRDANIRLDQLGTTDFLSKYGRSYSTGERVVVVNQDRAKTAGQYGSVVSSSEDMTSVRLDSGEEHWYMASELEYQHVKDNEW